MHLIIYIAMIASIIGLKKWGAKETLIRVYLPVLLLLPDTYHAITPGLPDPSFNQAAIIPLFVVAALESFKHWKISFTDSLVVVFAAVVFYSEFINAGYSEAQNLSFVVLFGMVAPYFVARWLIAREQLDVRVAKMMVLILSGLALFGFFEAKMGFNPFLAILGPFFPGQGYWVTTFRHGLARVAGPYAHAILACTIMVVVYRLQRWLHWGGFWEYKWARWPNHPFTKAQTLTAALVLGAAMTVVRGPMLGGVAGGVMAWISRAKNKKRALIIVLVGGVVGVFAGLQLLDAYLAVAPGQKMTMSQESAMYRAELMDKYKVIALDHMWLGWGRNTWPKIGGMASIDNYFLLLSLMHGLTATLLLVTIMMSIAVRSMIRGMREPAQYNSLSFCFAGIMVAIFVSLATVYLGENLIPFFFFICGWAEGHLQRPFMTEPHRADAQANAAIAQPKAFEFKHVIS